MTAEPLFKAWAVFVAQWVERLLTTPEIRGLNPAIRKFYLLSTVLNLFRKDKNEKVAGNGPFQKV